MMHDTPTVVVACDPPSDPLPPGDLWRCRCGRLWLRVQRGWLFTREADSLLLLDEEPS